MKLYDKVLFDYYSFVFDWRCSNRNHSHSISVKEIEKERVSHFLPLATPIVCAFVCEKKHLKKYTEITFSKKKQYLQIESPAEC